MSKNNQLILIVSLLFLIVNVIVAYEYQNELDIKLCENGGIEFSGSCICPYSYSGNKCEINSTEICSTVKDGDADLGNFCCWNKYRASINAKAQALGNNAIVNESEQHSKLESLLKVYGPWSKNDILYFNYLFKKNSDTGKYSLKYLNLEYNVPNDNRLKPLAFVLMIHNVDIESIDTLFKILYKPYHYFVIHIDSNYNNASQIELLEQYFENVQAESKKSDSKYKDYPSNIHVLKRSYYGLWGGISLVYIELSSYTVLFDMVKERINKIGSNENSQWSHVINLSANDFPTISLAKLQEFLTQNQNTSYLADCCIINTFRFNYTFYEKFPKKYDMVSTNIFLENDCGREGSYQYVDICQYGTQWHILNHKYAHYLIGDMKAVEVLLSLKFFWVPDETFFQASKRYYPLPIGHKFEVDVRRTTMWSTNSDAHDSSRFAVSLADVEKLSGREFFVRKVYPHQKDVKEAIIKKFHTIE
ncbi:GlcNAc transferase [Tieghemostelium lacteum]|uniref:protein xylosyltransferase n=1 Tax=Tieghemostelium lacteum TaxID=361077 RepID=A0A152A6H2_TIELA|nr:GlcNAc transferase [Tieghemostelium lacteum]|eukprot:KYR01828.1 GlcNAc transferase [Tieghemostelium lacteum]